MSNVFYSLLDNYKLTLMQLKQNILITYKIEMDKSLNILMKLIKHLLKPNNKRHKMKLSV